jgi:hypothetical protein
MMKALCTILLLLSASLVSAQDVVFDHPLELPRSLKDQRGCYPIVDSKTGRIYLVLFNHKAVNTLILKSDFTFLTERTDEKPSDLKEILGHAVDSTHLSLFFNTASSSKITRLKLNLANGEKQIDRLEVGDSNEKYLSSFSIDNKFLVLQAVKNSDVLSLYAYNGDIALPAIRYDFTGTKFSLEEGDVLETILRQTKPEFLESNIPNPLEVASAKTKLFKTDSSLLLTLDNEHYRTTVLTLPLHGQPGSVKFFNHGFIDCEGSLTYSSNSYVNTNILYQFKVCQTGMAVTIANLKTGAVTKTFTVQRDGEINFKNTDIIQEGSETNPEAKRELNKTKQFLRKCSYSNAAISVYPQRDEMVMLVGSYKELSRGGAGMPMYTPGSQISTPGGTITTPGSYNPVYTGYGASRFSKAVYFKSKLKNSTFEHSPGLVFDDAFKRIKKYSEVHIQAKNYTSAGDITSEPLIAETVFRNNDRYYLGYYEKEKKKYVIREFR